MYQHNTQLTSLEFHEDKKFHLATFHESFLLQWLDGEGEK